jgi:predicted nucleotidyltransferase
MRSSRVIEILRDHRLELQSAGISHLRVFGSIARGDSSVSSDIDLLADFDRSKRLTLVTIGSLQDRLTHILGSRVDLSSPDWMREAVRKEAEHEAVVAF